MTTSKKPPSFDLPSSGAPSDTGWVYRSTPPVQVTPAPPPPRAVSLASPAAPPSTRTIRTVSPVATGPVERALEWLSQPLQLAVVIVLAAPQLAARTKR